MEKSKKIIIIVIIVSAVILAAILTEIFLLRARESKEVSNNDLQNTGSNVENTEDPNSQNQNTYVPNFNDVGGNSDLPTNFEIASTSYYYNQLNNVGKTIYDKFKNDKDKFKTGTYVFDFGSEFNTLLHTDNGTEELNKAFQDAWDAFNYDHADLFYVDTSKVTLITQYTSIGGINTYNVTVEPRGEGNYLKAEFPTQADVEKAQRQVKYMMNQVIEQTQGDSVYQKVVKVHEWLVRHIQYDKESKNGSNIYGPLLEQKANCEGYSKLFKYVLEQINVSCVLVSGTATNSEGKQENHAWNYLQLNSQWYAVDVTWDDPILLNGAELTEERRNKYFLKGSTTLSQDHKEGGVFSEKGSTFKFPTISTQDY